MKKTQLLILSIIIILSAAVYSATQQNVNLELKESVAIVGVNFTLLSFGSNNKLSMSINGKEHILSAIETEYLEGITVTPGLIYDANRWRNFSVDFNITVDYTCGNVVCEANLSESSTYCCADCNCSSGYTCYNKRCIKSDLINCYSDEECDDNDPCTIDYCNKELPITCMHTGIDCNEEVEEVINETVEETNITEDNNTADEVNVTKDPTLEDEFCSTDADCDDNNTNTIDKCDAASLCTHINQSESTNKITGDVAVEAEWHSEKKGIFRKFFDWLKGLF